MDPVYNDRQEITSSNARLLNADLSVSGTYVAGAYRSYTLDGQGNRTADQQMGETGSYSVNNLNQYTSTPEDLFESKHSS